MILKTIYALLGVISFLSMIGSASRKNPYDLAVYGVVLITWAINAEFILAR